VKSEVERKLKGREISSEGYTRVEKLPRVVEQGVSYWIDSPNGRQELTHQLFRFPAKFHPPVVRWALGNYGRKGSVVLDPFTGSGTVQVEALVRDISSIGIDIDPLACLIARTKTTPLNPATLQGYLNEIQATLEPFVQSRSAQAISPGSDITEEQYMKEVAGLTVPAIPNIFHWFRRYVIVDIARILWAIGQLNLTVQELQFFQACTVAIIRRVSNADPDPVSGLEVTSVQIKRNTTRIIRAFDNFFAKTQQAIQGMDELWRVYGTRGLQAEAHVVNGDMLKLAELLSDEPLAQDGFPLVITSPPYCRSVEYSRRHQLEMYWLGLVNNQAEHISLTHTYIGRKLVRISDWDEKLKFGVKPLDDTLLQIAEHDATKARTVKHYFYSMGKVFSELKQVMKREGTLVCVIGNSVCCKVSIPTADFIVEIASENFELKKRFSYALRNHYMQYGLWNGDGIKQEHVLVMKPK
jgi:methylase of polypeptide subunit release factors